MRRQWVLQSRHLESRAKGVARLVIEVSAGCASPSFRGLWGGEALLLSPPALLETEILGFAGPRRIAEPADEQVEGGLVGGGAHRALGVVHGPLDVLEQPRPAARFQRVQQPPRAGHKRHGQHHGEQQRRNGAGVHLDVRPGACSVRNVLSWWVECVGSEELCVVLASW